MRTAQGVYFALLILGALISLKFGIYPLLIIVAAVVLISFWSRLRHPSVWVGHGFKIRVKYDFRDEGWVDYEEEGRSLFLRSVWGTEKPACLHVQIEQPLYLPPDYTNPLPDGRVNEIRERIAEGLKRLKIRHTFV